MQGGSRPDHDAVRDAWKAHIDGLKTEPLTVSGLAKLFDLDRKTMARILERFVARKTAEKIGRFYRVRLQEMPPAYHAQRGLGPVMGNGGDC